MKPRYLAISLVLAGVSTFAAAQSSSNPFARPSPATASAAAASMPAPSAPPAGTLPGGMPALNGIPGMPGMGGMPGMPEANVITEDVQASRVGAINGMRIYRGANTYLFEKASAKKLVRNLVAQSPSGSGASDPSHPATASAMAGAPPQSLPSFVGKPAPKN